VPSCGFTTIYRGYDIPLTPHLVGVSSTDVHNFAGFCTGCGERGGGQAEGRRWAGGGPGSRRDVRGMTAESLRDVCGMFAGDGSLGPTRDATFGRSARIERPKEASRRPRPRWLCRTPFRRNPCVTFCTKSCATFCRMSCPPFCRSNCTTTGELSQIDLPRHSPRQSVTTRAGHPSAAEHPSPFCRMSCPPLCRSNCTTTGELSQIDLSRHCMRQSVTTRAGHPSAPQHPSPFCKSCCTTERHGRRAGRCHYRAGDCYLRGVLSSPR